MQNIALYTGRSFFFFKCNFCPKGKCQFLYDIWTDNNFPHLQLLKKQILKCPNRNAQPFHSKIMNKNAAWEYIALEFCL